VCLSRGFGSAVSRRGWGSGDYGPGDRISAGGSAAGAASRPSRGDEVFILEGDIAGLVGRDEWAAVNETGRPFVLYKFATTLDGRVAAVDGTSRWITSPVSRAEVHLLRAACDATMVGSGTQRADDPKLAVRAHDDPRFEGFTMAPEAQPLRVVVDTNARTPDDARVLNDAAPTVIAVARDADAGHLPSSVVVRIGRSVQGLDLSELLAVLLGRGVRAIFLEGGPTLAGSFLAGGFIDRVVNYVAPALLGAGPPGLGSAGIETIGDIRRLEVLDLARSGPDVRIVARPLVAP
jgi:diaminohydroxyphosphoribosylaminopyrimidine deaminase/5-amino-6-(5-phosphoribosylamino)uracil reductase